MSIRLHRKHVQDTVMSADELARLVDARFCEFRSAMARAGNPGAADHSLGSSTCNGWLLDRDPGLDDSDPSVVLGTDGAVHVLLDWWTQATRQCSASEWLLGLPSRVEPRQRARRFSQMLSEILARHQVPDE